IAILDLGGVNSYIDASRHTHCTAVSNIKATVVLGALDFVLEQEAVGEVSLLVRAQAVTGVHPTSQPIDGEALRAMIEPRDIFVADLVQRCDANPLGHGFRLSRLSACLQPARRAAPGRSDHAADESAPARSLCRQ